MLLLLTGNGATVVATVAATPEFIFGEGRAQTGMIQFDKGEDSNFPGDGCRVFGMAVGPRPSGLKEQETS